MNNAAHAVRARIQDGVEVLLDVAVPAAHAVRATVVPTRIRVGPFMYTVTRAPSVDSRHLFAETDNVLREIHLSKTARPAETAVSVLHELMHTAWNVYGLSTFEIKDLSQEQIVDCLSTGLAQVLGDIGLWPREIVLEDEGQPGGV